MYSDIKIKDLLTPREIEVLTLISNGLTTDEIAEHLFVSRNTVISHRKNMMKKATARNMIQMVSMGFRSRLFAI